MSSFFIIHIISSIDIACQTFFHRISQVWEVVILIHFNQVVIFLAFLRE